MFNRDDLEIRGNRIIKKVWEDVYNFNYETLVEVNHPNSYVILKEILKTLT